MRFANSGGLSSGGLLVLTLSALAAALPAQTTHLELGKTISGDLSVGQTQSYSITLDANQYLRAVVTQPVAAAVVELDDPNGKKIVELDTRNYSKSTKILSVAEDAGEYHINVSGAGHYEIKLEELRAAGDDDRKRVQAERLFAQGLIEARKSANDHAVTLYTSALGLSRDIHDREREGASLNALGLAYYNLSQYDKAAALCEQALPIRREVKDRNGEGETLNNLGLIYDALSQREKAIRMYEQALVIFRE